MARHSVWVGAVATLAMLAGASAAEPAHHPSFIHHALHELKLARHDLKEAKHDFGGHRAAALDATDSAIRHLEKLIGHPHYKLYTGNLKTHVNENHKYHSHIHHALHALKEARAELKASPHDFGGQKEIALVEVDVAIRQLELVVKHHRK
jgi:hypothetical protein